MKVSDVCLPVVFGAAVIFATSPWDHAPFDAVAFLKEQQARSVTVAVGQGANSNQLEAAGGNASSPQVGTGHSSVVVGDIQQSQDGDGQSDMVNAGSVPADFTSMARGDIRNVAVQGRQMVLSCEGVCTITIPTGL